MSQFLGDKGLEPLQYPRLDWELEHDSSGDETVDTDHVSPEPEPEPEPVEFDHTPIIRGGDNRVIDGLEPVFLGETLSVDDGGATGDPVLVLSYQWQSNQAPWENISGETGSTFAVDAAVAAHPEIQGQYLRCVVTATNGGGSVSAESAAVGPIPF